MSDTDKKIATKGMGWIVLKDSLSGREYYADKATAKIIFWVEDWHPSTNMAQAFEVVEKFDGWLVRTIADGKYRSNLELKNSIFIAEADTPAMAICLAALEAEGE